MTMLGLMVSMLGTAGCPGGDSTAGEASRDGGASSANTGSGGGHAAHAEPSAKSTELDAGPRVAVDAGGHQVADVDAAPEATTDAAITDAAASESTDSGTVAHDAGPAMIAYALELTSGDVSANLSCPKAHGVTTYDEGEWVGVAFDSLNVYYGDASSSCATPPTANHFVLVVLAYGGPKPSLAPGSYDLADPATAAKLAVRLIISGPGEGPDAPYTEYGTKDRLSQPLAPTGTVEVRTFDTGAEATHAGSTYDVELHDVVLKKSYASDNTPFATEATVIHAILH